jgi:hypothetical protein
MKELRKEVGLYVCMYLFTANGPKSGGRIT